MIWVLAGKQNSCYTEVMKKQTNTNTHEANQPQTALKAKSIKLGMAVKWEAERVPMRQLPSLTGLLICNGLLIVRNAHRQLMFVQSNDPVYTSDPRNERVVG